MYTHTHCLGSLAGIIFSELFFNREFYFLGGCGGFSWLLVVFDNFLVAFGFWWLLAFGGFWILLASGFWLLVFRVVQIQFVSIVSDLP